MRLSTFKETLKGFTQSLFLGVLLSVTVEGAGSFHIKGAYDLDQDGLQEALLINSINGSLIWVEISESGNQTEMWSYSLPQGKSFNDALIWDLNGDGHEELVAILNGIMQVGDGENNHRWLYVFSGSDSGFSSEPTTLSTNLEGTGLINPSNLTTIPGLDQSLAVACGSPLRGGLILQIESSENGWTIQESTVITSPAIQNGYAKVFVGAFVSAEGSYLSLISQEGSNLKTSIFDISQGFTLSNSTSLPLGDARRILGADIQPFQSTASSQRGLLIPFGTDDVMMLTTQNNKQVLTKTSLTGERAFPAFTDNEVVGIVSLIEKRKKSTVYESQANQNEYLPNPEELGTIPPPPPPIFDEVASLKSKKVEENFNPTSLPENGNYGQVSNEKKSKENNLASLTPTIGDFLASVKKELPEDESTGEKIAVPNVNEEMESITWADEAGFEQVDLGEFVEEMVPMDTLSPIPNQDEGILSFSDSIKESMVPKPNSDTTLMTRSDDGVDLYYVLAMTPAGDTRDRYVFDGEAPFGVSVNQVPPTGTATHFQHGISANLANLDRAQTYDFAYSLRDARLDSITTLTMVHDMQTEVVFMSISPTDDSLSQSYQPEAFDPKLFEFPDYFFEGFPTSLDMDFTDKLIRFSFDGEADSTYNGIYLSSTTPSVPPQSLAVFLDQGTLQAVRGEIVVRANGSKKVTTEFDLVGHVEPSLMFSQLIEENFPDDLKVKLLQGASLETPLFGPNGNLPKISREKRLPKAQPALTEPEIPVEPKQTHVPVGQGVMTDDKAPKEVDVPTPQEDEEEPETFQPEKMITAEPEPSETDSLKLEKAKEPVEVNEEIEGQVAEPEASQPAPEDNRRNQF